MIGEISQSCSSVIKIKIKDKCKRKMEIVLKSFAFILCISLCTGILTSCGNTDRGDGTGHMYDVSLLGNPKSLDPQFADDPSSNTVIKNLYSGLLTADENGNIQCCNAESYTVSEDGLVYTFNLRPDNYWFFDENQDDFIDSTEYSQVVADDYVFAFQRILDPSMKSPYAEEFSCIANGQKIINGEMMTDEIGVFAVDKSTLVITLDYPSAEFLKLLTTNASFPCNRTFFFNTKGRYGLDDRSVMSNGAFYVRQWFYDPYGVNNILYMKRNDKNDSENFDISPYYLNFTIESEESDIKERVKSGETECLTTFSKEGFSENRYNISSTQATTLGLIFNPDDQYFSNKNIQKALAYSIQREELWYDLSDDVQVASGIIPPSFKMLGRSYRDIVSDRSFDVYSDEGAVVCYQKGMRQLEIESVGETKILVNVDTVNSEYLHRLSQEWQKIFGCYIGIEDVSDSEFYSRIESGDYSIALYPLKADNCTGLSVMEQFEKCGFLNYAVPNGNFTQRILQCPDIESLIDCYHEIENEIISGCGFIPLFYKNSYLISNIDNEDIKYDAFSGAVDYRTAKNYR